MGKRGIVPVGRGRKGQGIMLGLQRPLLLLGVLGRVERLVVGRWLRLVLRYGVGSILLEGLRVLGRGRCGGGGQVLRRGRAWLASGQGVLFRLGGSLLEGGEPVKGLLLLEIGHALLLLLLLRGSGGCRLCTPGVKLLLELQERVGVVRARSAPSCWGLLQRRLVLRLLLIHQRRCLEWLVVVG